MDRALSNEIEKFAYVMRLLRTLYLAMNEDLADHPMRVLMRYVFVQVDNLEKMAGRLKNRLAQSGYLVGRKKLAVEEAIKTLMSSHTSSLDVIRDKMMAHAQIMDPHRFLEYWSFMDAESLDLLYNDVTALEDAFLKCKVVKYKQVGGDFKLKPIDPDNPIGKSYRPVVLAVDRAAALRSNAVQVLAPQQLQSSVLSVSMVDALLIDFRLSSLVDDPSTIYNLNLFDIAWLMAICDSCSLVDSLFEDSAHGDCTLTEWLREGIEGAAALSALSATRDRRLESQVRKIRNRLGAHMDSFATLETLRTQFYALDLTEFHFYVSSLMVAFQEICAMDMRTKVLSMHNAKMNNVQSVRNTISVFRP